MSQSRTYVHNAARSTFGQPLAEGRGQPHGGLHVESLNERLFVHVVAQKLTFLPATRIVHQQTDIKIPGLPVDPIDVFGIGKVGSHRANVDAVFLFDLGRHRLQLFTAASHQDRIDPFLGKLHRELLTDTASGAGDDSPGSITLGESQLLVVDLICIGRALEHRQYVGFLVLRKLRTAVVLPEG